MSITTHERPGVYVEYDTTNRSAATGRRMAGIAALGTGSGLYRFSSPEAAAQTFPATTTIGKMLALAFANGASQVACCPVSGNGAYAAAFSRLLTDGEVTSLATDCADTSALLALATQLADTACVAFAGLSSPSISDLTELAQALNCERLVLTGADVRYAGDETCGGGGLAAAALAGLLSAQDDPALPLSGAQLCGLDLVSLILSEAQIDTLVRAGVSPLELTGGQVRLIRAVTTRTATEQTPDDTWRELTTVCIIDDVIPAVRSALASKFLRHKNTEATRNAIRSQAAIVLDDRVRREIIEGYDMLTVAAVTGDPACCEVSFQFRVVHGLCRIHLKVHILV